MFVKVVFDGGYQMWRDTYIFPASLFGVVTLKPAYPNDSPPHPCSLAVQVDVFAAMFGQLAA